MLKIGLFVALLSVFVIWVKQGSTFPSDDVAAAEIENSTLAHNITKKRILTPEEEEIANEARAHIAKVLERNLIRLFAVITQQQQQRERQSRQDEEDIDDEDTTFNSNTLPQVAQLLGAIFAGNVNLTSVVDQAFYLVPQTVRNQVSGIFKLLGGQAAEAESGEAAVLNTTIANPSPGPNRIPAPRPKPRITTSTEGPGDAAAFIPPGGFAIPAAAPVAPVEAIESTTRRLKYKNNNWRTAPTVAPIPEEDVNFQDDELIHLEKELVVKAKEYAPYAKKKEPRFFVNSLQQLFSSNNLNMTQVVRLMPDIFKGARQAFILLEDLGVLPDGIFPGADADDEDD